MNFEPAYAGRRARNLFSSSQQALVALDSRRNYGKRRASDLSREVGNGERCDFTQRNAFRALDARKLLHADAKRLDCDRSIGHSVAHFVRSDKMQITVLASHLKTSQMPAQFRYWIAGNGNRREVPQIGDDRRNMIREGAGVPFFRWWKQKRIPSLIGKNCSGQTNFHGCAFRPFFGQKICNA